MKKDFYITVALGVVLYGSVFVFGYHKVRAADPTTEPLLQQGDLVYEGAFRVPSGTYGTEEGSYFSYGGTALGYDPIRNGLFMTGMGWYQLSAEIGIPQIIKSENLDDLATAPMLQNFTDVTEGRRKSIMTNINDAANGVNLGGHLVYNGKLYVTAWGYYVNAGAANSSHFVSSTDLSQTGDVQGPFRVGVLEPGYMGGYMALIPQEWQSLLGAPAFTGQCCISVMSARTSLGPTVSTFDPADIGVKNPVPATPLVVYPINDPIYGSHDTLGSYYDGGVSGPYYAGTTSVGGVVFPDGTRSVLFFGARGIGPDCYGTNAQCGDPVGSKGPHAPPYVFQVWAYDANDLLAVKNGQKQPWEVVPYTGWTLDFSPSPWANVAPTIGGVAYDSVTKRIFVSQYERDTVGYSADPLIRVFSFHPVTGRPVISFSASPAVGSPATAIINRGQSSTLSWNVSNATSVSIDNNIGNVAASGTLIVSPTRSTSYKITASNSAGTVTGYVKVRVNYPDVPNVVSFTATPVTITLGQSTTLSWTTTNAATVILSGFGLVPDSGTMSVSPTETTEYSVAASNPSLHLYKSTTVTVTPSSGTRIGDLNNDGTVDIFDYNILIGNFGRTGTGIVGDLNNDGKVDIYDYNLLVGNFGK